jgi:hypothetical protein
VSPSHLPRLGGWACVTHLSGLSLCHSPQWAEPVSLTLVGWACVTHLSGLSLCHSPQWAEPVSLTFHSVLRKLYTELSIGASYQTSVHLDTRFQRRRFLAKWAKNLHVISKYHEFEIKKNKIKVVGVKPS